MHDYRPRWGQRADEVYRDIAWPRAINGTPAVARDEQTLVDAIEGAERRRDATILRDIQLALADELPLEVLPALVEETARELAERYHTIAMWVIHPPEARGDRRNVHAHILLCTRRLDAMGDGFGRKLRILDDRRTGPHEIVWMRNRWCELVNGRLARSGSEARIYPGRRLDAPPMPTIARRYVARAHKRAARRERLAARREGRQAVPIRKRVAELATLGKPANRAMGEIARHVAAGYDVPESERKYETRARTRYDRAEEYDQAKRDATHYASLPVVCEELAAVNAELDSLEHRIDAHRAVREADFARAEPVTRVAVVPPVAPPFLEADVVEGASGVAPRIEFEPGAMAEPSAPEPVTPPAPASVVVPVALEEDGRKHDLGLKLLAEAADSARPEPVTRVAVVPPVAPPFLDADIVEDASGVAPRIEFEPGAMAEPSAPEPVTPPAPASVVVPVALGEDGRKHDLGLKLRLAVGFDATGEPACPDPIARRVVAPIQAPAALGDESGDREPDLEERVEQVAIFYEARDRETRQIAVTYSHPEVCARLVEEAMRWQMGETPGPMPRLSGIPRDSDANQLCAGAWGRALRSELDELRSFGGDRERIEPHIERVCTRARTDDAWRGRILDTFARFVAPRYVLDLGAAELADRDPAQREARAATGERLRRLFAEGGIDAWYEQTVARAAGLKVDWSFGELTRSRASGLIAEDTLRLLLLPFIRDAQSLCRAFPRRSAGRADATTLGEWHGRLVRLVSGLRQNLSQPKVHQALIDETVESMLPDVYLEQMRGGLSRGPTKRGPPTLADRDRALRELTRQRARDAGLGDDFDVSRGRASAVRQPAGESREVEPPAPPELQMANIELEHHRRIVEEFKGVQDDEAERKREEAHARRDYGDDAVRLANDFRRLSDEHGELQLNFISHHPSSGTLQFIDCEGIVRHASRESPSTLARMQALITGRPPKDIPELELDITKVIAAERARQQEPGG